MREDGPIEREVFDATEQSDIRMAHEWMLFEKEERNSVSKKPHGTAQIRTKEAR